MHIIIVDWMIPFAAYTAADFAAYTAADSQCFNGLDNPQKLPIPVGGSWPHLIHGSLDLQWVKSPINWPASAAIFAKYIRVTITKTHRSYYMCHLPQQAASMISRSKIQQQPNQNNKITSGMNVMMLYFWLRIIFPGNFWSVGPEGLAKYTDLGL